MKTPVFLLVNSYERPGTQDINIKAFATREEAVDEMHRQLLDAINEYDDRPTFTYLSEIDGFASIRENCVHQEMSDVWNIQEHCVDFDDSLIVYDGFRNFVVSNEGLPHYSDWKATVMGLKQAQECVEKLRAAGRPDARAIILTCKTSDKDETTSN